MEVLAYIAILFVGITLSVVGGGGSILTVPAFVYLFSLPADLSTSYSLFLVGLSAAVGAAQYAKQGLVNYKVGAIFAAPAFLGVFLVRRFLMPSIPETIEAFSLEFSKDQMIMSVFAAIMLIASYSMIRSPKDSNDSESVTIKQQLNIPVIMLEGLLVGAVTGFVGAGGGFLIIPALVLLAKLPMKEAVGTSLMIITVKSLLGFTGDLGQLQIDWLFLVTTAAIAIVGILIGARIAKYIPGNKLKKGFGIFVLLMGAFILSQQLMQ